MTAQGHDGRKIDMLAPDVRRRQNCTILYRLRRALKLFTLLVICQRFGLLGHKPFEFAYSSEPRGRTEFLDPESPVQQDDAKDVEHDIDPEYAPLSPFLAWVDV